MKTVIGQLWHGNIAPGPNCGVGVAEIERLSVLIERNREALKMTLSPEQKERLEKYTDCEEEYCSLLAEQAFSDGFCLASRLLAEVFTREA